VLQLKSLDDIASSNTWWLRARHHFAIGPYGNPDHKPVGNLIVLNDDEIAPHAGFGLHQHANVEIVSYIHDGTLTHRDDQGNAGTVRAGDVQVMSAGTGIRHSERNEEDSTVRMFQIWLQPNASGGAPTWGVQVISDSRSRWIDRDSGERPECRRCTTHSRRRGGGWRDASGRDSHHVHLQKR
jgi:redox-sensitive bicupin YhaK (pirin superfamily)